MADLPEVGSVWSFRTRPCTEFSPPDTGRYAALKVIEATPRLIAVVLLDGVWNASPDLEAVARRDLLLRRTERFDEGKLVRGEEFYHKAIEGGGWTIAEFSKPRLVGVLPLTAQEAKFALLYRDRLMGGRADVRRLLKGCMEWFNAAEAEAGEVIQTEEREDIRQVLEEMAHVARQKALVEKIEDWRAW